MIKLKIERINQKIKILDFESAILKETEQEDAAMLKELKAEANKELIKTNALIQLYSGITAIADTILKGDFEAAKEKTVEVLTKKYDLKRIEDGEKELLAQWFKEVNSKKINSRITKINATPTLESRIAQLNNNALVVLAGYLKNAS